MANHRGNNDIEEFIDIRGQIEELLQSSPQILTPFIEDPANGFIDQLPNPVEKPHITTTAQCLRVILESEYLIEIREKIVPKVWEFFHKNDWESGGVSEHNIYVAPQVLIITCKLGIRRENNEKVNNAIKYIVLTLKTFLETGQQEFKRVICTHGFIIYSALKALSLYENELNQTEIKIVRNIIYYVQYSLFKQLALHYSGSRTGFDVEQLAYYLLSYVEFGNSINPQIVDKAIEIICTEQKDNGTWELSQPFLHRPEGGEMRCFSIEIATAVLKVPKFTTLLPRYFSKLKNTLYWTINNMRTENGYKGWRSDSHWTEGPPEAWASALVYEFLNYFLISLNKNINILLLKTLKGGIAFPKVLWEDIVDYKNFKKLIKTNIIVPIEERGMPEKSAIILFGPPGTGKTTIAEALAYECKWPIIKITPANFLIEGANSLIKIANMTFEKLSLLENAVILFDEFDEFVTARETEKEKYGRFITTAMLPWLQKLEENRMTVAIMTTNHIERFDMAIIRSGRFDLILPIGPPEEDEKIRLVKRLVTGLSDGIIRKLAITMDKRMTVCEILEFCKFLKNIRDHENLMDMAIRKLKEMSEHLIIDKETMERFEGNNKIARC